MQNSNDDNKIEEYQETIPKLVFIVPYRDREQQQQFFDSHMKNILQDFPEKYYEIKYIHQKDTRSFNRGAMKNIGFLYIKNKYPNDYQNITIIFNDIDTMPFTKNFLNYDTDLGNIKHFYGYKFSLGGILSIKGKDFEYINGFHNYWAWGYEDNALQYRVKKAGLSIDRSQFYEVMDKNILQINHNLERFINKNEYDRFINEKKYKIIDDGISTISNLEYNEDKEKNFINVTNFTTKTPDSPGKTKIYDLRKGNIPFKTIISKYSGNMKMNLF